MNTIHLLYTIKCVYYICNVFLTLDGVPSCIWRTTRTSYYVLEAFYETNHSSILLAQ